MGRALTTTLSSAPLATASTVPPHMHSNPFQLDVPLHSPVSPLSAVPFAFYKCCSAIYTAAYMEVTLVRHIPCIPANKLTNC